MSNYKIYSIPLSDAVVHAAEDGTVVIDRDDQPVTRWRTAQIVPVPLPVPHDLSGSF